MTIRSDQEQGKQRVSLLLVAQMTPGPGALVLWLRKRFVAKTQGTYVLESSSYGFLSIVFRQFNDDGCR